MTTLQRKLPTLRMAATVAVLLAACAAATAQQSVAARIPSDSVLRRYAAQMLMVGFKGNTAGPESDAARYVRDLGVGSIILFDIDLTGDATIGSRNITSREQLTALTAQLQSYTGGRPLLIAADQEGGRVQRLKPPYGYEAIPSAEYIGQTNDADTTRFYGRLIASQLSTSGVNVCLGPVLDVYHPDCPAIGRLHRSYGDAASVVRHAGITFDQLRRHHVLGAAKHFPGHGSATVDSHWGLVDVTGTWTPIEMEPFRQLIKKGKVDIVMMAHLYNGNIDPDYPATLSQKTITGVLRKQLGFDGVVVTDDMYMEGIINKYSIENALVLAINAGADMLCVGNNINTGFEADRPFRLVDMIVRAVHQGRIPWGRLVESHKRIERLYKRLR